MRVLSLAIPFLILVIGGRITDSPHGSDFKISCSVCHTPEGWELDRDIYSFDHNSTKLPLEGQHASINCKMCHPTLVFSDAETDCFSCHTDMHYQTVGTDCARCHTPKSWIVENITDIHRQGRFPLQGPHYMANCLDCHPSASQLRFEPLGIECIDCHIQDYQSATNPDHVLGNFSTDCLECHAMTAFEWGGAGFDHTFFPLTGGHTVYDCNACHNGTDYSNISAECASCHQDDYNSTTNPNHISASFSTECMECHTTLPGWSPAEINHSFFPLTQGHIVNDCNQCHDPADYSNISSECVSCHQTDYNNTNNPNHTAASFSTECMECHTTLPGWSPAEINHSFFPLTQGHTVNDCNQCHDPADYSNISTECISCHQDDYNNSTNPNHNSANISTDCMECHTTLPGWKPAEFPIHDAQFFPIYSGEHNGEWDNCTDCHNNLSNYAQFSCLNCHEHSREEMDDKHSEQVGYEYTSTACLECHPTGSHE